MLDTQVFAAESAAEGGLMALKTNDRVNSRVLVIEDNAEIVNLLMLYLLSFGFEPETIRDGRQAIRHIGGAEPPGVVLLDRMLPGATGDSILETMRASPVWAKVPVVVLSARSDLDEMTQVMLTGADAYLTKPFQAAQLIQIIEKYAGYSGRAGK